MKNSKFFTLFRTLKKDEILAFRKNLKQQHGGEAIALQVFEYASTCYPNFRDKKLNLSFAYEKIFGTPLNESENKRKLFLNTLSDLHLWLKDFLLCERILGNTFESRITWLSILSEREGMQAEYARQSTHLYQEIIANPKKDIQACVQDIMAGYFYYQQLASLIPTPELSLFEECLNAIKPSVETISLKMAAEMSNLKKIRTNEKRDKSTAAASDKPEIIVAQSPTLLLIYQKILLLVETKEESHYYALKAMLYEHQSEIAPIELHNIFKYLYNYAAAQSRGSKSAIFVKELHELNIYGSAHGFLAQRKEMSSTEFSNIVNVACTQKDFAWAQDFILLHSGYLHADIRDDLTSLSKAMIAFEQGHFEEVIDLLKSTGSKDDHFILRSRTLLLRAYFELDKDVNFIWDYCTSFKAQLGRTRKPHPAAVVATLEFIRVFKLLLLEETDKQGLINIIEDNPNLYFRNWLLAKTKTYKPMYATRQQSK